MNELVPTFNECIHNSNEIISSLHIVLTIDKKGKLIDVEFRKSELASTCKEELKNKILTMKGWDPGKVNGQNVCSKFIWPIGCLKLE